MQLTSFIIDLSVIVLKTHSPQFWITNLIALFIGYCIGHCIFAKIISCILNKKIDQYYSKNLGATNVARVWGIALGFTTFLFDMTKTFAACYLFFILKIETTYFSQCIFFVAGVGVFLGHCLPIFFKFRGGKGLSCLAGLILVFNPLLGCLLIMSYILFSVLFKNSIFAMILTMILVISCIFAPHIGNLFLLKFYQPNYNAHSIAAFLFIACCGLSLLFHHDNFVRFVKNPFHPRSNPLHYQAIITKIRLKRNKMLLITHRQH